MYIISTEFLAETVYKEDEMKAFREMKLEAVSISDMAETNNGGHHTIMIASIGLDLEVDENHKTLLFVRCTHIEAITVILFFKNTMSPNVFLNT